MPLISRCHEFNSAQRRLNAVNEFGDGRGFQQTKFPKGADDKTRNCLPSSGTGSRVLLRAASETLLEINDPERSLPPLVSSSTPLRFLTGISSPPSKSFGTH
ncbi:hypothetical protein CEXT_742141 [Caerostris extrusa]|uniref:Uncharacterized protein n=1 Tax=Caerostris extrusa TaxID=172846 RepID=A0AAV4SNU2_CAEEX|nr:hypothetical protein CEXT_742141 [Caerostris extrusa]